MCCASLPVVTVALSLKAFLKTPVRRGSASLLISHGCRSFAGEKCGSLELCKYFKLVFIQKVFLRLLALLAGLAGHPSRLELNKTSVFGAFSLRIQLFHLFLVGFALQVDVMKNAYNQGLECDHEEENGDDGISPKDVGHNIYILAHQVSLICCVAASRKVLHS